MQFAPTVDFFLLLMMVPFLHSSVLHIAEGFSIFSPQQETYLLTSKARTHFTCSSSPCIVFALRFSQASTESIISLCFKSVLFTCTNLTLSEGENMPSTLKQVQNAELGLVSSKKIQLCVPVIIL